MTVLERMESPLAPEQSRVEFKPSSGLPRSARPFAFWNEREQRDQQVPDFVAQLNQRVNKMVQSGGLSEEGEARKLFDRAIALYRDVVNKDVELYRRSVKNLERISTEVGPDKFVIYGRDADYLAMAIAAHQFGRTPMIGKPVRLSISSEMGYGTTNRPEVLEQVRKLFEQKGITKDSIHIDIGKYGNVPRSIIRALWPDLTQEEVNSKVKLVDPYHLKQKIANIHHSQMSRKDKSSAIKELRENPGFQPIESLGEIQEIEDLLFGRNYATIESRPHTTTQATHFVEDPNGKVSIPQRTADPKSVLLGWVVSQAVVREFLPRPPKRPFWHSWGKKK